MEQIVSIIATVFSIAISLLGFPIQIWKLYKTKNPETLSPILFLISLGSYLLWTFRSYLIKDWYMFTAYLPGCIFCTILIIQIFYYKRKTKKALLTSRAFKFM